MILGLDFVIGALLVISTLIPVYIYRHKLLGFIYAKSNFKTFILEIKKYLKNTYPKMRFDFDIIEKTKDEKNEKARCILVVEDLTRQFANYEKEIDTQDPIDSSLVWENYQILSEPVRDKLPKDWAKRKVLVWERDEKRCKRCGISLNINDAKVDLLKDIHDGGTYHFENLVTFCNDCSKLTSSNNKEKAAKYLEFQDRLLNKII